MRRTIAYLTPRYARSLTEYKMLFECPGSKHIKQPVPENVTCPFCAYEVEIFSDEVKARCPNCKKFVVRGPIQSCLDWCKFAEACVGESAYKKYLVGKRASV